MRALGRKNFSSLETLIDETLARRRAQHKPRASLSLEQLLQEYIVADQKLPKAALSNSDILQCSIPAVRLTILETKLGVPTSKFRKDLRVFL